ncbi:endoglucanase [candidate division KSB1 bacterium]|nr:glycoside hydrolase family 9 protein [candidate division KSB1 bacterium]RQW05541.1 MAG: endoglucanase [candidate division KSB1 bacterium]
MKKTIFVLVAIMSVTLLFGENKIHLNSIGFTPDAPKKATITTPCSEFQIRSLDGNVVLTGETTGPLHQDDVDQDVWIADFSHLRQEGEFYVEASNVGKSVQFQISNEVYNVSFYTSMRAMYLWRCGTAVRGEHNGETFSHAICHMNDAYEDYLGRPGQQRDGTGGWHDAGDHGKYVVNAGITVGSLFLAWDHFHNKLKDFSLDLPDTAPGYPDYLKEIKWETDWLLKMAYPDGSGRISHKLTRTNFSGFVMPEDDDGKRFFTEWSSAATADFVAMMAMAARYFAPYDAEYAATCLSAAKRSYNFLLANPEDKRWQQGDFRTGGYASSDGDDRLWAAAEMWETTGDSACLADFEQRMQNYQPPRRRGEAAPSTARKVDEDWDWGNVRNLAVFTYVLSTRDGKNSELLAQLKSDILAVADDIVARAQQDVYGRPLLRYYWGCNGTIARQVINLQVANKISPKAEYVETALDAIAHIFGRNYYNRSYVTGLGFKPPLFPHDRRSGADDIEAPWPGYIIGGGHSAIGWVDEQASYATNEIAINWQAALIYALAGFVSP